MAEIYDNIDAKFRDGLLGMISQTGVERVDFCVGYFNLRGWQMIVDEVDRLPGGDVLEGDDMQRRTCRLLVGMQRPADELVRQMYSREGERVDSDYANRCRLQTAAAFRRQLLLGLPTGQAERTLRRLATQLREGRVCVKLSTREPLHA